MKMRRLKYICSIAIISITALSLSSNMSIAKPKLNKTKLTLSIGNSFKLKVKKYSQKIKWASNKKKIASVNNKGIVKAKSEGKCNISAKVKHYKFVCKLTVRKTKNSHDNSVYDDLNSNKPTVPSNIPIVPSSKASNIPTYTNIPSAGTMTPAKTKPPVNTYVPAPTSSPNTTNPPDVTKSPNVTNTQIPNDTDNPDVTSSPKPTVDPNSLSAMPTVDPLTKDDGWIEGWY